VSRYLPTIGPAVAFFSAGVHDCRAAFVQRAVDGALLVLLEPLALEISVPVTIVLWAEGGAVPYSQMRVGKEGQLFQLSKFRTMARTQTHSYVTTLLGVSVLRLNRCRAANCMLIPASAR
jgi:lipopolysaccharide/colanic/teichoic acid biosynthesis glycosyltransferase